MPPYVPLSRTYVHHYIEPRVRPPPPLRGLGHGDTVTVEWLWVDGAGSSKKVRRGILGRNVQWESRRLLRRPLISIMVLWCDARNWPLDTSQTYTRAVVLIASCQYREWLPEGLPEGPQAAQNAPTSLTVQDVQL